MCFRLAEAKEEGNVNPPLLVARLEMKFIRLVVQIAVENYNPIRFIRHLRERGGIKGGEGAARVIPRYSALIGVILREFGVDSWLIRVRCHKAPSCCCTPSPPVSSGIHPLWRTNREGEAGL